ncbi:MAG: hypothetical protein AAGN66_05290, partial [Acidobacteriota bacterium]
IDGQKLSLTVAPWKAEVAVKIGDRFTKLTGFPGKRFEFSEGSEVLGTAKRQGRSIRIDFGDRTFKLERDLKSVQHYRFSEHQEHLGEIMLSPGTFAASRTTSTVLGVPAEVHAMTMALLMVRSSNTLGGAIAVFLFLQYLVLLVAILGAALGV